MKKFIAYLTQGSGCDHTIGCGKDIIRLAANSIEDAKKGLIEEIIKCDYQQYGYRQLEEATLFEIIDEKRLDMKDIYEKIGEEEIIKYKKETEERERVDAERLKKKFNQK